MLALAQEPEPNFHIPELPRVLSDSQLATMVHASAFGHATQTCDTFAEACGIQIAAGKLAKKFADSELSLPVTKSVECDLALKRILGFSRQFSQTCMNNLQDMRSIGRGERAHFTSAQVKVILGSMHGILSNICFACAAIEDAIEEDDITDLTKKIVTLTKGARRLIATQVGFLDGKVTVEEKRLSEVAVSIQNACDEHFRGVVSVSVDKSLDGTRSINTNLSLLSRIILEAVKDSTEVAKARFLAERGPEDQLVVSVVFEAEPNNENFIRVRIKDNADGIRGHWIETLLGKDGATEIQPIYTPAGTSKPGSLGVGMSEFYETIRLLGGSFVKASNIEQNGEIVGLEHTFSLRAVHASKDINVTDLANAYLPHIAVAI